MLVVPSAEAHRCRHVRDRMSRRGLLLDRLIVADGNIRRLRWSLRCTSRSRSDRWRIKFLGRSHQRASYRHCGNMRCPRRRTWRFWHRLVPRHCEPIHRCCRALAAAYRSSAGLPPRSRHVRTSYRDQRTSDRWLVAACPWSFRASSYRDRLRISFCDRGIVARRVDPPLSDLFISAAAGAIFWAVIRRGIFPTSTALERRVTTLEATLAEVLSELRATRRRATDLPSNISDTRNGGHGRDGFAAIDHSDFTNSGEVLSDPSAQCTKLDDDVGHHMLE